MQNQEMMSEESPTPPEQNKAFTVLGQFIGDIQQAMPETIKKNFLKAGNQLIFGMADIPVAWFEQFSKRIRRKTEAMDMIQQGENTAIVKLFESDPALAQETLNFNSLKEYKAFFNRQKVIQGAMEELKNNPPEEDTEKEIDEDWLEMFSRAAETKSSEEVQMIFSKILAGEIREPGSFSPNTIHLLSVMDTKTARAFNSLTRYTISIRSTENRLTSIPGLKTGLFYVAILGRSATEKIPTYPELKVVQDIGLLKPDTQKLRLSEIFSLETKTYIGSNQLILSQDQLIEIIRLKRQSREVDIYFFTNSGEELLSLLSFEPVNQDYLSALSRMILGPKRPKKDVVIRI